MAWNVLLILWHLNKNILMKRFWISVIFVGIVLLGIVALSIYGHNNNWHECLFGKRVVTETLSGEKQIEDNTPTGEYVKLVGAFIGGILVIWGLVVSNSRVKEMNTQNKIALRGQINTRFKDASVLLADERASANIAGIHALHQIAEETSTDPTQKHYVKIVNDILCAFIRANSKRDSNEEGIVESVHNLKEEIVIQTIVDVLFKSKNNVYRKFKLEADLYGSVFKGITFNDANLLNVKFWRAYFEEVWFIDAQISNVNFRKATFSDVSFKRAKFILPTVNFFKAKFMNDLDFSESALENVLLQELVEMNIKTDVDNKLKRTKPVKNKKGSKESIS